MRIAQWQKVFAQIIAERYKTPMTTEQRLLAIVRQVADASMELAKHEKSIQTHHVSHVDHRQAIACIFIDLFVLCEDHGVNLDEELAKSVRWFNDNAPPEA